MNTLEILPPRFERATKDAKDKKQESNLETYRGLLVKVGHEIANILNDSYQLRDMEVAERVYTLKTMTSCLSEMTKLEMSIEAAQLDGENNVIRIYNESGLIKVIED